MSERFYRLGRGPWHHKSIGFGVSQAHWIWSEPGCWIVQISNERRGAAATDEVDVRVLHGVFPLPMGMEREDRCE